MTTRRPRYPDLLVRQSAIGNFSGPGPRPALRPDPVLHWARRGLLPLSSIMRVHTTDPVFALTYDDGPEPGETTDLLDVLASRGVAATFFVLSDRAEAHPEIIRRMLREGHEVALHGIDHTRLTSLPGREAVRQIQVSRGRLQAITGRTVRYYRPTYGAVDLPTFVTSRLRGMDIVIWSAWAEDWFDAPAADVAERAVAALHPGAILLLHDTTDPAQSPPDRPLPSFSRAEVAERVLDGARDAGLRVLPLPTLLADYPVVRALTVQRPRLGFRRG